MTTQIPITLNGRPYVADLGEYRRRSLPVRRESTDQSESPGEQSLTTEGEWRRRYTRFDGGMFQFQQDHADSDARRPRVSVNMARGKKDGGPYCTLPMWLPEAAITTGQTPSVRPRRPDRGIGQVGLAKVNGANHDLVVINDGTTQTTRFAAVAGVLSVALDPHDDDIGGNATIFHSTAANVYKNNAVFAAFGAVDLFLFRDHFIAAVGATLPGATGLREMSRTGTFGGAGQLDYTIPSGDGTWNIVDMQAVNDGYLLLVNRGEILKSRVSELLFIGIDQDGLLVDPILVERMTTWAWGFAVDGDTFMIADSNGYRFGVYLSDGNVEMGPWFGIGDDLSQRVGTGMSAAWKYGQMDAHRGRFYVLHPTGYRYGLATHTWFSHPPHAQVLVFDTTDFVAPLVPAITESFGPAATGGAAGTVNYLICTAKPPALEEDDSREAVMLFRNAVDVRTWRRSTNISGSSLMVAQGAACIQTGLLSFGIAEKKVITRAVIRLSDVIPNHGWQLVVQALRYDASTGTETFSTLGTYGSGSGPIIEIAIGGAPLDSFGLLLEWQFGSATGTSMIGVEEIVVYGLPVPQRTEEWQIPILLSEQVAVPGDPQGTVYTYDTKAEFELIKALERDATPITLVEGGNSYTVVVDQIQVEPHSWNSQLSFFEGVVRLRLLSTGET